LDTCVSGFLFLVRLSYQSLRHVLKRSLRDENYVVLGSVDWFPAHHTVTACDLCFTMHHEDYSTLEEGNGTALFFRCYRLSLEWAVHAD